jgi:hypothetical protein
VYWFHRPRYARYTFAIVLILTAVWLDIRPEDTVQRPFAGSDIAAGDDPAVADIEWRTIPANVGIDPITTEDLAVAPRFSRSIQQGDPILRSDLARSDAGVPADWWILPFGLPPDSVPGQAVQIVVIPTQGVEAPPPIPAVVVRPAPSDPGLLGSSGGIGQVAVPPEHAATAAIAAAANRVSILLSARG